MFKKFIPYLVPSLLGLLLICSFCFSVAALSKSTKNERAIVQVQSDLAAIVKSQEKLQKQIIQRFDSLDAHVALIEKYAQAEYYHFYGDVSNMSIYEKNKKNSSKSK